jgi:hypothetical protein
MSDEETRSLTKIETNIQRLFKTKTPKTAIKMRKGANGMMFPYVPIDYVVKELDNAFGIFWEFLVDNVRTTGKQIIVRGRLVIKSPNGFSISRPGVGRSTIKMYQGTINPVDEGNDEKAATSDAIKKAASLFGIAADVYYKEIEKYEDVPEEIDESEERKQKSMSRFFSVAADRGFAGEAAKTRIKEVYDVRHMEELSADKIDAATRSLEKYYEVVTPGEEPRKIGQIMPVTVKKPEEYPDTESAASSSGSALSEEVKPEEEEDGKRYCYNTDKHGDDKVVIPEGSPFKSFCNQDCEDQYWKKGAYGNGKESKKKRFEDFIKNGGKAGISATG